MALWLERLGADVTGLALPPLEPSLFRDAHVGSICRSIERDIRDAGAVAQVLEDVRPDVVFHLAAQSLVRAAHRDPLGTFATNVLGTANLLEVVRVGHRPKAVVVVTSDKCYDLRTASLPRSEDDPLGGSEPYSASKAACEHVVGAYRHSFFPPERVGDHGVAIATVRAGNVIGGGDHAKDRIVPDAMRALAAGGPISVRNPSHVRPWQHVLEPLSGYLLLGARLLGPTAAAHAEAWNFGPADEHSVRELVQHLIGSWGGGSWHEDPRRDGPTETSALRISSEKARRRLGWAPRWGLAEACERTVRWYRARASGATAAELASLCREDIAAHTAAAAAVA